MGTRPCKPVKKIESTKLLETKTAKMMKWTTDILVAVTASFNEDRRRNRTSKLSAIFKPKKLLFQSWFLSWDNSPSPYCHLCSRVPGSEHIKTIPPYSQDINPADFFTFQKHESWLASRYCKGSCGLSLKMSMPPPFSSCVSTAIITFGSMTTTLRKVEK